MRHPTAKERMVMQLALEGLGQDIACLTSQDPQQALSHDVHGTFRTNLEVLTNIRKRLQEEHP
jgi:hypothetical protein